MNLADILALTLLLLVGGYIVAVGVLPQLFTWLTSRIGAAHSSAEGRSHPSAG